jgi:hypothetical protein
MLYVYNLNKLFGIKKRAQDNQVESQQSNLEVQDNQAGPQQGNIEGQEKKEEKSEDVAKLDSTSILDELGKNWVNKLANYSCLAAFLNRVEAEINPEVKNKIGKFYGILFDTELQKLEDSCTTLSEGEKSTTISVLKSFYSPEADPSSGLKKGMAFISTYKSVSNYDPLRRADKKFYRLVWKGVHGEPPQITEEERQEYLQFLEELMPKINKYRTKRNMSLYEEKRKLIPIVVLLNEKLGEGKYKVTTQKGAWFDSSTSQMVSGEGGFIVTNIDLKTAVEIGVTYDQWAILYARDGNWWWIECEHAKKEFDNGKSEDDILKYYTYERPEKVKRGEEGFDWDLPRGDLFIPMFRVQVLEVFPEASGITYVPFTRGVGVKAVGKSDIEIRKQKIKDMLRGKQQGGQKEKPDSGEAGTPKDETKETPATSESEQQSLTESTEGGTSESEELDDNKTAALKATIASVVDEILDWNKIEGFVRLVMDDANADRKVARFIRRQIESNREKILATLYGKLVGKISFASKGVGYFYALEEFGKRLASRLGYKGKRITDVIYRVFIESLNENKL